MTLLSVESLEALCLCGAISRGISTKKTPRTLRGTEEKSWTTQLNKCHEEKAHCTGDAVTGDFY